VNVHPAKTEVKFVSDKQVFDGVYYAALSAVTNNGLSSECEIKDSKFADASHTPEQTYRGGSSAPVRDGHYGFSPASADYTHSGDSSNSGYSGDSDQTLKGRMKTSGNGFKSMQIDEYQRKYGSGKHQQPLYNSSPKTNNVSAFEDESDNSGFNNTLFINQQPSSNASSGVGSASATGPESDNSGFNNSLFINQQPSSNTSSGAGSASATGSESDNSGSRIPDSAFGTVPFRVIGETLNTYIIVEYQNSVWFIDKHAAHERIHFNALRDDGFEPMSQALITPVVCRHGYEDVSVLLEHSELLEKLGFTVENFGDDAVAVRRIPAEIDIGDAEPALSEICAELKRGGTAQPAHRDNILRTVACKAAIKAGRSSGTRELEALAARVISGEISQCPHGRPVAFELTKQTLDKGFKRI
jgi:DNA mismatch repair protein MutL